MDCLNHALFSYIIVGHIYNFEETDTKTWFWLVKIKWDNARHSLSLTRKTPSICFSFSDISHTFSHFLNQKLFIFIHLSLFIHTIQNNIILPSSKSFHRGNYVGDKSSERQFFSGAISSKILSGSRYLWGNCPEAIIWRQSSRGRFSRGGIFLGGSFARGQLS